MASSKKQPRQAATVGAAWFAPLIAYVPRQYQVAVRRLAEEVGPDGLRGVALGLLLGIAGTQPKKVRGRPLGSGNIDNRDEDDTVLYGAAYVWAPIVRMFEEGRLTKGQFQDAIDGTARFVAGSIAKKLYPETDDDESAKAREALTKRNRSRIRQRAAEVKTTAQKTDV